MKGFFIYNAGAFVEIIVAFMKTFLKKKNAERVSAYISISAYRVIASQPASICIFMCIRICVYLYMYSINITKYSQMADKIIDDKFPNSNMTLVIEFMMSTTPHVEL